MKKRYVILALVAALVAYLRFTSSQPVEGQPFPAEITAKRRLAAEEARAEQARAVRAIIRQPATLPSGLPANLESHQLREHYGVLWDIHDWKVRLNAYMATCLHGQRLHVEYRTDWAVTESGQLEPLSSEVHRDFIKVSDEDAAAFSKCLEPFFSDPSNAPFWNGSGEPGSQQTFHTQFWSPVEDDPIYAYVRKLEP